MNNSEIIDLKNKGDHNKEEIIKILKKDCNLPHLETIDDEEMHRKIKSYNPQPLRDYSKRPYNSIIIIILLFVFGITFINLGFYKFFSESSIENYLPYFILGFILLVPSGYYSYILICVWIGRQGYTYELIPDVNE